MKHWYVARGGQQKGPISVDQLKSAIAAGRVSGEDLVWCDGMAEWTAAAQVAELQPNPAADVAIPVQPVDAGQPVAAVQPAAPTAALPPVGGAEVSYYTDRGLPPRAAESLKQFALPTGDIGVWPLDDTEISQWIEASKQRKLIRSASGMFRSLALLNGIVGLFMLFGVIAASTARRGGFMVGLIGTGAVLAIFVGITVLFALAASASKRNQVWAPITITALIALETAVQLVAMVISLVNERRDFIPLLLANFFGVAINVAFLVVSARAIPAIRKFRASPAWCQELTAVAKM